MSVRPLASLFRSLECVTIKQVYPIAGSSGVRSAPTRSNRCRMIVGGPFGQIRNLSIQRDACNFSDTLKRLWFMHDLGTTITCVRKLALVFLACALIDHTTNCVGETRTCHTVQDNLSNCKLSFDSFTARFKIQGFGHAAPCTVTFDAWLAI